MIYNDYGYEIFSENDLISLLFKEKSIDGCLVDKHDPLIKKYMDTCSELSQDHGLNEYVQPSDELDVYYYNKTSNWLIPHEYAGIDVYSYVADVVSAIDFTSKPYTIDIAIDRITIELQLYEKNELMNLLRSLIYLKDIAYNNDIVLGCGRGSSVSSYVLYILGIHRVDPIKYDLSLSDFFKDIEE